MSGNVKYFLFIILMAVITVSATGCWDQVEVENRLYIMAIGVDYIGGQKPYLLTFEIPVIKELTSGGMGSGKMSKGTGGKPAWMLRVRTDTIANAMDAISSLTYKQPFVGHLKVVVLSEDAAKQGILSLLDFLERDPSSQRRVKLAICKGKAQDILNIIPKLDKLVAISLSQQITQSENSMRVIDMDIGKFESMTWDYPQLGILIPMVAGFQDGINIAGAGIMCGGKLVGMVGGKEVQGYNWISSNRYGGAAEFGMESIQVEGGKTRVTCRIENGIPVFKIAIAAKGRLDQKAETLDKQSVDLNHINMGFDRYIRERVSATIDSIRKTGIDYIGLGEYLYKHYPHTWDALAPDWKTVVRRMPVSVEVSAAITGEGLVR